MNKIIIKGRLTRDPEMKTGGSGVEFCKFSVAVNRRPVKDKPDVADFFDCTAFGNTGAAIGKYMAKGREILVEGRMESSHSDKDGQKRTFWGVTVDSFEFCGSKGDAAPAAAPASSEPVPVDPPADLPF